MRFNMAVNMPTPDEPVQLALIGAGQRTSTQYQPLFNALHPWIEVVAVCDPVREHTDALAAELGVEAYYDIYELVEERPMEATVAVTPIPSHHSISLLMSQNGVHNMVETTIASSLIQARQMVDAARENDVVFRVAENFFRKPIDRIVQQIMWNDGLEGIKRIFSYDSHTGYHNNSRWLTFAREHPIWVQSIEHEMPTVSFHSTPQRFHDSETFRSRYFAFPDGLMVADQAANIKGFLGRHPRPGYTEWQGERGTVVYRGLQSEADGSDLGGFDDDPDAEVRYCSDNALENGAGRTYSRYPIETEIVDNDWIETSVNLPSGRLAYENPLRLSKLCETTEQKDEIRVTYGIEIMGHLVDFALAVRGIREGEYTDEDALAAMMMEMGARESSLQEGRRIHLPIEDDLEADKKVHDNLESEYGVDPLDADEMLGIAYPKQ